MLGGRGRTTSIEAHRRVEGRAEIPSLAHRLEEAPDEADADVTRVNAKREQRAAASSDGACSMHAGAVSPSSSLIMVALPLGAIARQRIRRKTLAERA